MSKALMNLSKLKDASNRSLGHELLDVRYYLLLPYFVKPHQALEGMTPAQRAGLGVGGWNELISEALKQSK